MNGAEFCRSIGISTPLYQKWKSGSIPGYDKLRLIADMFDVKVEWLLTGKVDTGVWSDMRDMLNQAKGATGLRNPQLADLMNVSHADVVAALAGNPVSAAFSQAFEDKLMPIVDALRNAPNSVPIAHSHDTQTKVSRCLNCARLEREVDFLRASLASALERIPRQG